MITGPCLNFFAAQHREQLIQTLLPVELILIARHLQINMLEKRPCGSRALHHPSYDQQPELSCPAGKNCRHERRTNKASTQQDTVSTYVAPASH